MHPEIGHIYPRRHPLDLDFEGVCPFHRDCLEGMASGPAIVARSGSSLQHLDAEHPQWEIEADYLGQLCAQLVMTISPQRIVMGGGVMSQARLLPLIRERMRHWLGGYIDRERDPGGRGPLCGRTGVGGPRRGTRRLAAGHGRRRERASVTASHFIDLPARKRNCRRSPTARSCRRNANLAD